MKNRVENIWEGKTILVVGRKKSQLHTVEECFEKYGAIVIQGQSKEEVVEIFMTFKIDSIFMDIELYNSIIGYEITNVIIAMNPELSIKLISLEGNLIYISKDFASKFEAIHLNTI